MKTLTEKEKQEVFSKGIYKDALEVVQRVAEITREEYKDDVRVYLAGGALRDAAYSRFKPNDLDLFFVGELDDDPRDTLTWLTVLYSKLQTDFVPSRNLTALSNVGTFYVEKLVHNGNGLERYIDYPPGIDFIHHPNKGTIEEVVSEFDYELVKAWYDPYEDTFKTLPEFWDVYLGGRIVPKTIQARRRIEGWRQRERTLTPRLTIARDKVPNLTTTNTWVVASPFQRGVGRRVFDLEAWAGPAEGDARLPNF